MQIGVGFKLFNPDDWPGHDKPGRNWGIASRVNYRGRSYSVIGARKADEGEWAIALISAEGEFLWADESELDRENPSVLG